VYPIHQPLQFFNLLQVGFHLPGPLEVRPKRCKVIPSHPDLVPKACQSGLSQPGHKVLGRTGVSTRVPRDVDDQPVCVVAEVSQLRVRVISYAERKVREPQESYLQALRLNDTRIHAVVFSSTHPLDEALRQSFRKYGSYSSKLCLDQLFRRHSIDHDQLVANMKREVRQPGDALIESSR